MNSFVRQQCVETSTMLKLSSATVVLWPWNKHRKSKPALLAWQHIKECPEHHGGWFPCWSSEGICNALTLRLICFSISMHYRDYVDRLFGWDPSSVEKKHFSPSHSSCWDYFCSQYLKASIRWMLCLCRLVISLSQTVFYHNFHYLWRTHNQMLSQYLRKYAISKP